MLQVIVTTALPALAQKVKEVEQRNPRKQSAACQSTKTMATNITANQYNGKQIAKSRKCNVLQSNVSQAASEVDSAQGDVFHSSNQIAQCQLTTTRASNVARNAAANPRKQIAACQSTETMATNIASNQYIGEQIAK